MVECGDWMLTSAVFLGLVSSNDTMTTPAKSTLQNVYEVLLATFSFFCLIKQSPK